MSFKKIACVAALAALVASPALAQPSLSVTNAGLDANGDWIWEVTLNSDADGAEGVEFGAEFSGAGLVGATAPTPTGAGNGGLETDNPGEPVFGWETLGEGTGGAYAAGLQTDGNQAFYSYGLGITGVAEDVLLATFTTEGPSTAGSLTTGVDVMGAYDASGVLAGTLPGTHGIIAQSSGKTAVAYSESVTVTPGDANLSYGSTPVTVADLAILAASLNQDLGPRYWQHGDFNGTEGGAEVTVADLAILAGNLNKTIPVVAASTAAPEPTVLALAGVGLLGLGVRRRR